MGLKGKSSEPQECNSRLRKNLRSLYNSVFHWANPAGLQPIGAFLELPSKEEYPTYTTVVVQPICMNMVETRLKGGLYRKEQDLMADLMLMFANCRFFNQEMSQVFQDADTLEQVLFAKAKQLDLEFPERPLVVAKPIPATELNTNEQTPRGKGTKARKNFTPKCPPRKRKNTASMRSPPKMKALKAEGNDVDVSREVGWEAEGLGRRAKAVVSYLEPSLKDKMRRERSAERQNNSPKGKMRQGDKSVKVSAVAPIEKFVQSERRSRQSSTSLPEKIKALYNTLKFYQDPKGFTLSSPFMKLPSRVEYPDYYQVIRQPLDLQGISRRRHQYETLEDAVSDCVLVFDNAMQFNMEGSQIYRDAKTLARVAQHWRPEAI